MWRKSAFFPFHSAMNLLCNCTIVGVAILSTRNNIVFMTRFGRIFLSALLLLAAGLASSCGSASQVSYLQDVGPDTTLALQQVRQLTIEPGDRLRISVFSRDRELSELFNLVDRNYSGGGSNNNERHPYTVDPDGNITMPTLGPVHVQGMTRLEVADLIQYKLMSTQLLLDPTVVVEYADMSFFALGEVGHPGRITIPTDQVTILEALALAGDLTIYGRRENVLVLRKYGDKEVPYYIDLTDSYSVYTSPVYYLQQNDMIYVEPNDQKRYQSDSNATYFRSAGFWISLPSLLVSLFVLVTKFFPISS